MRSDYTTIDRFFTDSTWPQKANRIIIHRQGNPGARAVNAIDYMAGAGLSIHEYIDADGTVFHCRHWDQLARHVNDQPGERRVRDRVASMGFTNTRDGVNFRGDWDSIGVESCDAIINGKLQLPQETRISLVLRVRDICRIADIPPSKIYEHSDFDPWNRSEDLGDTLNLIDFRADVQDAMDGMVPWRTTGPVATGGQAPLSWKPVDAPPPPPPAPAIDQRKLTNALNDVQAAMNRLRDVAEGRS